MELHRCHICQVMQSRIRTRKEGYTRDVFTDERGRIWNGFSCPPCHTKTVAARHKAQAEMRKEQRRREQLQRDLAGTFTPPPRANKACRKCGKDLDGLHYFHCNKCHHNIHQHSHHFYDWSERCGLAGAGGGFFESESDLGGGGEHTVL